ncbi:MAG: uncharacterized protein JWP61_2045 [Friedmanniella sp.]|jgi:hypothetical protein|nr:uncharacterized protein [Friedmanniella sp.]
MRHVVLSLTAVAVLASAGCSGGTPATVDSGAPTGSARSESPSAAEAAPAGACPDGTYTLARFVGVGDQSTYGTGEGGDVTLTFARGRYRLAGGGQPINLTLAGQRGTLAVNGTLGGTYQGSAPAVTFGKVDRTTGSATLAGVGRSQGLDMQQVGQVLAPTGSAQVTCTATTATINLDQVVLYLERR